MKPKILVTNPIPKQGIDMLAEKFDMEMGINKDISSQNAIIHKISNKQVLLPLLTESITDKVMDAAPELKIISNYAVGFNNIDLDAATERGILVTNTPGVLTETTADCAFAMMMAIGRRICESERFTRLGKFNGWEPLMFLGQDIHQKTLGIIGFGRIGMAMAKRGLGFDMKILYYNRSRLDASVEKQYNATYVSLNKLLKKSDYVSIHAPMTPDTHHLISHSEFNIMKKSACIVNTARGPLIDEKALIEALQEKKIFGAALDVFENEPDIPSEFKDLENVLIVPHIGSATFETRSKMAKIAAQNIINVFEGKAPISLVNTEVLKNNRIGLKPNS